MLNVVAPSGVPSRCLDPEKGSLFYPQISDEAEKSNALAYYRKCFTTLNTRAKKFWMTFNQSFYSRPFQNKERNVYSYKMIYLT
jgi:hypothetical protein